MSEPLNQISITLHIGEYTEFAPPLELSTGYTYFEAIVHRMREMARMIYALRPEVRLIEFDYKGVRMEFTPALSQAVEPGYKDSSGY